jgi:hypothetical protein
MANSKRGTPPRPRVRVRMHRQLAYMITAGIMAVMGSLFSTAAFAAGVNEVDVLAALFVMGAAGTLILLLLWYLAQLYES